MHGARSGSNEGKVVNEEAEREINGNKKRVGKKLQTYCECEI
jgi:hypothetical protein